jgi:enoyl-CoA hydratase/carnithine racemase
MELPLPDALARERDGIARLFETADAAEGFASFSEKRKPEFKGA